MDRHTTDAAMSLLEEAAGFNASDLHLDPIDDGHRIRLRVDGRFIERPTVTGDRSQRLIGRLKVLAGLMVYRSDIPQEGRLELGDGREGRLAVIPSIRGEKATVRLFSDTGTRDSVASLGLQPEHRGWLERALARESGLVVVAGPSGSGKTTTLYAVLQEILARRGDFCQVCTIEDPVERHIAGSTQVEVDRSRDLGFASGLKFLLRQDPEVVMVGEIRDAETARVAVRAAMTGHLVFSTLHCGRAAEGRARLLEMGVPEYATNLGLVGVIAQRLLRKPCEHCAEEGCETCHGTGFVGRRLVSEIVDRTDREPSPGLRESARRLVAEGLIPVSEMERVFGGDR